MTHATRLGLAALLATIALCACGSEQPELAAPPKVTNFALQSKLMGRQLYEELVTPAGGGEGRPLLVFLHGYGAAPSDTLSPAFVMAIRRLGDRAPVLVLSGAMDPFAPAPKVARLLEAAGFRNVQGRITGSPLDAILAVKPGI